MTDLSYFTMGRFHSRRALLRAAWYGVVKGYDGELCLRCGRPVMPHTGSWWTTDEDLWHRIGGDEFGVLCPPCFTNVAQVHEVYVHWRAVTERDPVVTNRSEIEASHPVGEAHNAPKVPGNSTRRGCR